MEMEDRYQATLAHLFSQFPQYQKVGGSAYKPGLACMLELDKALRSPHKRFHSIHVAGTNGKGSVSHMLAAILQQAGYSVGLYTSPHLMDFRERIKVNGERIPKEEVCQFVEKHQALLTGLRPSFFEITTAMAFHYFARQRVDIAVIETGLGGRLDSTNIIEPVLAIITNIGLDHCEYLGDTLPMIAVEKAGIIKPRVPVVVGERDPLTDPVFVQQAQGLRARICFAGDYYKIEEVIQEDGYQRFYVQRDGKIWSEDYLLDLKGAYQQKNLLTVMMAVELLQKMGKMLGRNILHIEVIKKGLMHAARLTGLRGRWELISQKPKILVDAAHNAHGITEAVAQLQKEHYSHLHFVFGVVVEKDLGSILPLLPKEAVYYFTQAQIPRALDAPVLAYRCRQEGLQGEVYEHVTEALSAARSKAGPQDLIFVGGSMFVVAEVLETIS